ncbi:MAG TPA: hypothetical protein VHA52_00595, partial [Candidatus Babeliaceae bacterium]|nr:hypothetical protein [Candidatus Babeliaceae bacterium]
MKNKNPGYVLLLTFMIISVSVLLISTLVNRAISYQKLSLLAQDREKAKMIALGGIEVAIAKLIAPQTKSQPEAQGKESSGDKEEQEKKKNEWFANILISINNWQNFNLKESVDGIDAESKVFIASEQGKLDLNSIYDFKEKKFISKGELDGRKLLAIFAEPFKEVLPNVNAVELIERYFKQRGKPLDDISQLLEIKEFSSVLITLFPSYAPEPSQEKTKTLILTDLFTVYNGKIQLQPLM